MRYEAISLGDVALQIFSVVVGILLALFINNWSTARQEQATVQTAMAAIRAELAANRIALRAHSAQMFDMAKRTHESPKNANQPLRRCYEWDEWRGIGGLNLVDAAYQAAIATQALAHMPFEQASQVSQTYGWQRYFQKGFDLDGTLLMGNPQSLEFCVGIIQVIGQDDLKLDAEYARLIGADGAAPSAASASH